jgi:cathepsin L
MQINADCMRYIFLSLWLLQITLFAQASSSTTGSVENIKSSKSDEEYFQPLFMSWMKTHEKAYPTITHLFQRYNIFKQNAIKIDAWNAVNDDITSYTMELNVFADMTSQEFKSQVLKYKKQAGGGAKPAIRTRNGVITNSNMHNRDYKQNITAAPSDIDWRTKNAVTPIKNQGSCGSCW